VGGFVEAIAKQQNKSKKEMKNDFFEHSRSALPRWMSWGDGDLRGWRALVGDKRSSAASRWWRLEGDSLKLAVAREDAGSTALEALRHAQLRGTSVLITAFAQLGSLLTSPPADPRSVAMCRSVTRGMP